MTEIQIQKRKNVIQMMSDIELKLSKMEDVPRTTKRTLKTKLHSVYGYMKHPKADLVKILKILGKLKLKATQVGNKENGVDTEVQTKFWDDVIQIVIQTFKKNKELK